MTQDKYEFPFWWAWTEGFLVHEEASERDRKDARILARIAFDAGKRVALREQHDQGWIRRLVEALKRAWKAFK